jgi:D-3-phosphoglycerate dehydrogenase
MPLPERAVRGLLGDVVDRVELVMLEPRTPVALHAALADVDMVLASWQGSHPLAFDRAAVEACGDRVVFVQQPSVGVDSVDVEGLKARSIPVSNTAGANAKAVAEWILAASMAVARSLVWADQEVRAGRWPQLEVTARGSSEIAALRVGILGMGNIATEVARLFQVFGGPVCYWSRQERPADATHGARWMPLDDLVAQSDLLISTLPLTPGTRGLMGAERLGSMPWGAMYVDAGRGGVVDADALLAALDAGTLRGAALDVHPVEPLPLGHPLRSHDRVVLSPHSAGSSAQSAIAIMLQAVDNVRRVLDGLPARDVVNGVDPQVVLRARSS